jgi:hypothetical protein
VALTKASFDRSKAAQRLWRRPAVPPPLRDALVPYVLLLLPAVLGAVFAWSWWVAAVLITPGFAVYEAKSWAAAKAQGATSSSDTGQVLVGFIAVPIAVVLAGIVRTDAGRFSILALVAYVIVVVDPLARAVWHKHRVQEGGVLPNESQIARFLASRRKAS